MPGLFLRAWRSCARDACALPAVAAAATSAATATVAATTATRTATAAGARLVLRLIHAQLPTTHVMTVQALDGARRIRLAHLDEPEAARPPGFPIGRQRYRLDGAMLRKQGPHVRLAGAERQVAYIDFSHR